MTEAPRKRMRATYQTTSPNPSVFYTALKNDGVTVLTPRTQTGVTVIGEFYTYSQLVTGIREFIAVWDEGDPADHHSEWIVVDTL